MSYDDFVHVQEQFELDRPNLLGDERPEPDPMPDVSAQVKEGVKKAHRNLGHPGRDAFVRMLRLGGASAEAIAYAKVWKCPVCLRCQPPAAVMPAAKSEAEYFNDIVGIDLLFVHDSNGDTFTILSAVDYDSRCHMAVAVPDKHPKTIARAFARFWLRWAGSPKKVTHDQGGEFQGAFSRLLDKLNASSFVTASVKGGLEHQIFSPFVASNSCACGN